jgi:Mn2+/Fe2+ NRAMP family transporter
MGNSFAADVNLGLLSFWVWAVVTNAHDGRLVRSSGQRPGRQDERRQEFPAVLFFGMVTIVIYLLCKMQMHQVVTFVLTALSVMLPALVLRLPQ